MKIDQRRFLLDDGTPFPWKMCTDFRLLHAFMNGEDLTAVIEQRRALGLRGVRVLGLAKRLFSLTINEAYYRVLASFFDWLAGHTLACELVVFADVNPAEVSVAAATSHLTRVADVAKRAPLVTLELVNEWPENGIDPSRYAAPGFVLCSRGSNLADGPCPQPFWDYATYHNRRTLPKGFCRSYKAEEEGWAKGLKGPFVFNEDIGAAEADDPGRRSRDPAVFAALAAGAKAAGAYCTFHSQSGLLSQLWTPTEERCARAWIAAHHEPDQLRRAGDRLRAEDSWWSGDSDTELKYQSDGNLVLYHHGNPVWASQTRSVPGEAILQHDGNFVVYDVVGVPQWSSGTISSRVTLMVKPGRFELREDNRLLFCAPSLQGLIFRDRHHD